MRKILLASAAMLGATGSLAFAQTANPAQGQYAGPWAGTALGAQNGNDTWGTAHPSGALAPAPGTVVIRLNGRVQAEVDADYGTLLTSPAGTIFGSTAAPNSVTISPTAAPANGATTNPATVKAAATATNANSNPAAYKLNPIGFASFLRLYPGVDGMATNGLRYGAAVEIRENFEGGNNFSITNTNSSSGGSAPAVSYPSGTGVGGTNASPSGYSSGQTLFVRRAFAYLGSDMAGILRIGQQDGLIGIYDATGKFTIGAWDGGVGNINNGGLQAVTPNQYLISWPFLSGNGVEYGNNKIVYLTPSFFGFDAGIEYAANQGNSFGQSSTSSPYQVGPCNTASNNCTNVTSGSDSSRWINRVSIGARYSGTIGGLGLDAYAAWVHSGKESIQGGGNVALGAATVNAVTGAAASTLATATSYGGAGAGTLKYDVQNFVNGGVAATFAGLTVNGDFTFGRTNGSNAMVTTGGAPMSAVLLGATYNIGPIALGYTAAMIDSQGAVQLTKISQRHEFAVAFGGTYKLAPGINLVAEYQYEQKHQGGYNFEAGTVIGATGAVSAASGGNNFNDIKVQGVTLATVISW